MNSKYISNKIFFKLFVLALKESSFFSFLALSAFTSFRKTILLTNSEVYITTFRMNVRPVQVNCNIWLSLGIFQHLFCHLHHCHCCLNMVCFFKTAYGHYKSADLFQFCLQPKATHCTCIYFDRYKENTHNSVAFYWHLIHIIIKFQEKNLNLNRDSNSDLQISISNTLTAN